MRRAREGRGTVSVLDARSGRRLRTVALRHGVGVMALDERANHLFVTAATQGSVTVLDARSGALLRTVAVGTHPIAMVVNQPRGQLLIGDLGPLNSSGEVTTNGSVSILTERTLELQGTLTVGAAPADLAVDERSGHALVVNSNYNPTDCSLAYVPVAEDGWTGGLRWLTRHLPWVPVALPPPPPPLAHGSVTLLDSARL